MQITLQTVRDVIRSGFGKECFVAGFIQSVTADDHTPTACIDAGGNLKYNAGFAQKHLQHPESLFCLLVHELCHCLFRHSVHGYGKVENLGEDALINAFITHAFQKASGKGRLFREFYAGEGVPGLLRPDSKLQHSRFGPLYSRLYGSSQSLSSGEVIHSLRVLLDGASESQMPRLLGSHEHAAEDVPDRVKEGIVQDLETILDGQSWCMGGGGPLLALFHERLRSVAGIKRAILRKYTTTQRLDRFVSVCREARMGVSPVPIAPSKRELILMHAGMMPPHFRRPIIANRNKQEGLAVYLDVSGSVESYLPRILGILERLEDVLKAVYLFSTKVVEVPFKEVMAGNIQTTLGTTFDCVAESIVENRFKRAIVLTDGFAYLTQEKEKALAESKVRLLTVLFGGARSCEPLAAYGDVVQLEDVVG